MSNYRHDAIWQRARETYCNPPGDSSAERMVQRMTSAMIMYSREDVELNDEQRQRITDLLRAGGGVSCPK